jgi:uncharacterized repeat protein (TIGR01451 family)
VAARLFRDEYLNAELGGKGPIWYEHIYVAPVNSGVRTPYDLDNDGTHEAVLNGEKRPDPGDCLGWGWFPGQYGDVLYSTYPIDADNARTFRDLLWMKMPNSRMPGEAWFTPDERAILPLASNTYWDVPIRIGDRIVRVLATHAKPPLGSGGEYECNADRNADQIRFLADYVAPGDGCYIEDDAGVAGCLTEGAHFVIMGDLNADPEDGDSRAGAIQQLIDPSLSLVDVSQTPSSVGGEKASKPKSAGGQGGANLSHSGKAKYDTGDFNDSHPGNLRVDYVLPSTTLDIIDCGVFWPWKDDPKIRVVDPDYVYDPSNPEHDPVWPTDHRLVWVDVILGDDSPPQVGLAVEIVGDPNVVGNEIDVKCTIENLEEISLRIATLTVETAGIDELLATDAPLEPGSGGIEMFHVTHEIAQDDIDRGVLQVVAAATVEAPSGLTNTVFAEASVGIKQDLGMTLAIEANRASATPGTTVVYTYAVTNTGNVSLYDVSASHITDSYPADGSLPFINLDPDAWDEVFPLQAVLLPGQAITSDVRRSVTFYDLLPSSRPRQLVSRGVARAAAPFGQTVEAIESYAVSLRKASWCSPGDPLLNPFIESIDEVIWDLLLWIVTAYYPNKATADLAGAFGGAQVRQALRHSSTGEEFVLRLLGWTVDGVSEGGAILTIGGEPLRDVTRWFGHELWPGQALQIVRGDDIQMGFLLRHSLTGGIVFDPTANLVIARADGLHSVVVRSELIRYNSARGRYEIGIETEDLEAGWYDLYIGTSIDATNRLIRFEIVDP